MDIVYRRHWPLKSFYLFVCIDYLTAWSLRCWRQQIYAMKFNISFFSLPVMCKCFYSFPANWLYQVNKCILTSNGTFKAAHFQSCRSVSCCVLLLLLLQKSSDALKAVDAESMSVKALKLMHFKRHVWRKINAVIFLKKKEDWELASILLS